MNRSSETPGRIDAVITDFCVEINNGVQKYGDYRSFHEAYAVILEEVDELWDELKKKDRDKARIYEEAIQVAATAYRLAEEIYVADRSGLSGSNK